MEQKRTAQLLEDALHAVRAAAEDGVVAGGGTALAQIASTLDPIIANSKGDVAEGVRLVKAALMKPLWRIAANAGGDADAIVVKVGGSRRAAATTRLSASTRICSRPGSSTRSA